MYIADESADKRNEDLWLARIKSGTLRYCHELFKLSSVFKEAHSAELNYEGYIRSKDEEIIKYIDLLIDYNRKNKWGEIGPDQSPFPSDLHGFIHEYNSDGGWFQPKHLMLKLGVLRNEADKINYEFLIEYDILTPSIEIYYGVKAISDDWEAGRDFADLVETQWNKIRAGRYPNLTHLFQDTDNINHGTFWPFWIRMKTDDYNSLGSVIKTLERFYNDFKEILKLENLENRQPRFDEIYSIIVKSHEYYINLLDIIDKECGRCKLRGSDKKENASEWFKKLLDKMVEEKYLEKCDADGSQFQIMKSKKKISVVAIFRTFFESLSGGKNSISNNKRYTPIKELQSVILDQNKQIIKRSTWDKAIGSSHEAHRKAYKDLDKWFGKEIEIREVVE